MFGLLRLNKHKAAVYLLLSALMIVGLILLLLRPGVPDAVSIAGESYPLTAACDDDIEAFLTACGYDPAECIGDRMITVPKSWNSVYTAYDDLQRAQGLGLAPYKGKQARELIYTLKGTDDRAAVLVSDGRIIAAHLGTMIYGGDIRPLIDE